MKHTVAIIGGGFCGTMVAVHLLKQKEVPLSILLVNAGYPLSKGLAYSSYSHKHLLNVRARHMSAFDDKPNDFTEWIRKHENYRVIDPTALPDMFLPRNIYGFYLKELFENAIRKKSDNVTIGFVHDEAIDLDRKDGRTEIYFSVSPPALADRVILATGNQLPANPSIETPSFYLSKNYFVNPWLHEAVSHPDPHKEILVIGNGLTMADVVVGLKEKNHQGKIYALSTNGFDIVAHRPPESSPAIPEELTPPYRLDKLVKLISRQVHEKGIRGEAITESLRPLVQQIWMSWTCEEKKWFMCHLRHLWDVTRHRLPLQIHEQIQQLIIDHKLEIIAARILDMKEDENGITVQFRRKRDQVEYSLTVARVINCTGPMTDITRMQRPLFDNLLQRRMIVPDELRLGIRTDADGAVIHADGTVSDSLYTLGSTLKGMLWESTAVPELRIQARALAEKILLQARERPPGPQKGELPMLHT